MMLAQLLNKMFFRSLLFGRSKQNIKLEIACHDKSDDHSTDDVAVRKDFLIEGDLLFFSVALCFFLRRRTPLKLLMLHHVYVS